MRDRTVKISKFLSLVLRHKPEEIDSNSTARAGFLFHSYYKPVTLMSFRLPMRNCKKL